MKATCTTFRQEKLETSTVPQRHHQHEQHPSTFLAPSASEDDWRTGPSRVLVACWWAVTVVVAAAYSGSLVAHLSLARPHLPFRSLEDVVKQQEYTWGTLVNASVHTMITVRWPFLRISIAFSPAW